MGLFKKKAKPPKPGSHKAKPSEKGDLEAAAPAAAPTPAPAAAPAEEPKGRRGKEPKPGKPEQPAKPEKVKKGKKVAVDAMEFLALRAELSDVRARLEASEQAKAIVESRLAALDATTTAMSTGGLGADDLRARLHAVETQLATVADTATTANITAEAAAAKATTAATLATEAAATPGATVADPGLAARVDALAEQLAQLAAAPAAATTTADAGLAARVDALAAQLALVNTAPDPSARLGELEGRVAQLAAAQAAPAPAPAPLLAVPAADPDTLARLDDLAAKVDQVDHFAGQIAQLNARVTAQAELGAQLSALRDRITELQNEQVDRRAALLAANDDAELRDRVNAISDRLAANDALVHQMGQLAERVTANDMAVRQSTEQVQSIEQRLNNVATELANQISELGRDIDGLAGAAGAAGQGSVSDEVIDALRSAQVRLANEQARYEIAFRQDLAALAEHVRRGNMH